MSFLLSAKHEELEQRLAQHAKLEETSALQSEEKTRYEDLAKALQSEVNELKRILETERQRHRHTETTFSNWLAETKGILIGKSA